MECTYERTRRSRKVDGGTGGGYRRKERDDKAVAAGNASKDRLIYEEDVRGKHKEQTKELRRRQSKEKKEKIMK